MSELLDMAERIVAQARPGEQIEVVVGRSQSTEVRAYRGEVEQFASATSAGLGVRVVADGRQGFAYAGTLDEDVTAETLAEARDNATFASEDEWLGLAEPDGVEAPVLDVYRDSLASVSTAERIERALELERMVRAADTRISAVESAPLTASTGPQELPAPPVGMLSTSCGPTAVGRSGSTRWAGCGPNMSASPTRWTPVTSGLRSPLCVGEYRQGESPRYRVDQSRETSEIGGGVLGA